MWLHSVTDESISSEEKASIAEKVSQKAKGQHK